ncbi:MAG: two pore domain potassium channel family protein [Methylotenera sp.]|nr:two pore domain potassium channel family protein [Methylotenera sp.]
MKNLLHFVKNHPSALLLLVQLASIIIHPILDDVKFNQAIFSCFNVAALSLAVWVVNRSPAINWVAWVLAVPAILLTLLFVTTANEHYYIWAQLLESAMYFYTAAGLILYMFNDDIITLDELFAAAATFTVLAWGFALLYSVCQYFIPGSITGSISPDAPRTWLELIYLSFSILSSTGYGDVMIAHPVTRIVGIFQMFVGLMYMALIVSRLVSLTTTMKKH